jgi:hypothetical protein
MIVIGFDATHANIAALPRGAPIVAGYSTGTGDVPWTAEDWAAHPGALRIDQDPAGSDPTADYYDVEDFAGTSARAPGWYREALACYQSGKRPGQRHPGFYTSAGNVTPLVNHLVAAGVTSGPRLIIANWNLTEGQAAADLAAAIALLASGGADPFPVAGIQFADPGPYDVDVYSRAWLDAVSVPPVTPPPARIIPTVAQIARAYENGRGPAAGKLFYDGAWYQVELVKI